MMSRSPVTAVVIAVLLVAATMQATSGWLGVVTTRGFSMEPTYRQGDLVVIRQTGSYKAGDVIAYRSEQLADEVVLHRVLDIRDGRYLTQGDNNDWVDTDRPSEDDVVGAAWFHVPGAGRLIAPLRRAGPLVAVGAFLVISLALSRSDRPDQEPRTTFMPIPARGRLLAPSARIWLLVALAASGVLSFVAFSQPASSLESEPVDVRHQGTFSYEAPAKRSIVYPDGRIDTGDPIFRSATDDLTIRYEHHVDVPGDTPIGMGTLTGPVVVRVGAWEHALPPLRPVPFERGVAAVETTIAVDDVQAVIDEYRIISGEKTNQASVVIAPTVTAKVPDATSTASTEFGASLALNVTPDEITVVHEQLTTTGSDTVDLLSDTTNYVEAFGQELAVADAKRAGIGAGIASTLLLIAATVLQRRAPDSAPVAAAVRGRLVMVGSLDHLDNTVAVLDQRAFLRIAGETDALVLHAVDDAGIDSFVVDDGRNRYRYTASACTTAQRSA